MADGPVQNLAAALLQWGLRMPVRPVAAQRAIDRARRGWTFGLCWALLISGVAGLRAGLATETGFHLPRFASSLGGFLLAPLFIWAACRALGGRGLISSVAASVAGAAVIFIPIDLVWSAAIAAGIAKGAVEVILFSLEAGTWVWAAIVLVQAVAEGQSMPRPRAFVALLAFLLSVIGAVVAVIVVRSGI